MGLEGGRTTTVKDRWSSSVPCLAPWSTRVCWRYPPSLSMLGTGFIRVRQWRSVAWVPELTLPRSFNLLIYLSMNWIDCYALLLLFSDSHWWGTCSPRCCHNQTGIVPTFRPSYCRQLFRSVPIFFVVQIVNLITIHLFIYLLHVLVVGQITVRHRAGVHRQLCSGLLPGIFSADRNPQMLDYIPSLLLNRPLNLFSVDSCSV